METATAIIALIAKIAEIGLKTYAETQEGKAERERDWEDARMLFQRAGGGLIRDFGANDATHRAEIDALRPVLENTIEVKPLDPPDPPEDTPAGRPPTVT